MDAGRRDLSVLQRQERRGGDLLATGCDRGRPWAGRSKHALFATRARPPDRRRPLPAGFAPRRILILQLQQLGDSVIFTGALQALRARFPDATIDILASGTSRHVYARWPGLGTLHVAADWRTGRGGNRLRPLLPLLRALRRRRYDLAVTDIAQQSFKYSLIAWATGAPVRVGFNVNGRGFLHTIQIPYRTGASYFACNLELAAALGADVRGARDAVWFGPDDVAAAESLLARLAVHPERPLVLMHPGSNWQSKTWFEDRWATLADRLIAEADAEVVLVGTEGEREYVERVRERMSAHARSAAGLTTIAQLAALAARAQLFVGTDSGPRHIAGATGVPSVMLMSAQEDTDNWIGFRAQETVLRRLPDCHGCFASTCSHRTCMAMISVDDALQACLRALRGATTAPALSAVTLERA